MLVGLALIFTGVFLACVAAIQTGKEDREKWEADSKKWEQTLKDMEQ